MTFTNSLADRIAQLERENAELREALQSQPRSAFRALALHFRLSPGEAEIIRHLYNAGGLLLLYRELVEALFVTNTDWRGESPPPDNPRYVLRTLTNRAQNKVKPEITIHNIYSKGYYLDR